MAYAQLRVDERTRAYVYASGANVLMTVTFTVVLVVFAGQGARGLLLGNFGASALVVLGLWWVLRARLWPRGLAVRRALGDLRAMLRFGLPTVPADASVYALQVADRFYLYRDYSHTAAGDYSVAVQLATVVFVIVRGFQYAWPPLAYSIDKRRRGGEAVCDRDHVLRARDRRRGGGGRAARALDRAPARGAQLLRRARGAALARARLDAVRPLPGDDRDHGARARDGPQPAGGRHRAGGEHRAARVARALRRPPASGSPERGSRCAGPTSRCSR